MPSLIIPTTPDSPSLNMDTTLTPTKDKSASTKKLKKEKKNKDPETTESTKKKEKKEKKRKLDVVDDEGVVSDKSDTSSELCDPVNVKKKAKLATEDTIMENSEEADDPNSLSKFRISKPLKDALIAKGIKGLFPIQAMTFHPVLDGADLVGRARTGQGKTLAFVLPILESIVNGRTKVFRKTNYGRSPCILVLLPTRELATQVFTDFQYYGGALGLSSCCVYGGASMQAQTNSLKRGVDIIVGTPGRVKDLLERGNLHLGSLQFRVLDEADEMLKMGFVDDVELILGKVDDVSKVQTLLFSATLPLWVKQISSRFLKPDKKTVDLVSDQKMKASTNVRHIVIPCSSSARAELIPDIIRCYSSGGRTIIFTETKESASQLSASLPGARALHGDIQQSQREVTLAGFRSGKFLTMVATSVAARGLDINDVQLIIQCEPPRDVEAYIHRSGRTGRAGNSGVAVMLYDPKRSGVAKIERESGVKFEHLPAPQPADVAKAAGIEAAEFITQISDSVIPAFKDAAEDLLNNSGRSAVDILAKALAKAAGYSDIKERSLLSGMENYVTLLLESSKPVYTPTFAFNLLRRFVPEDKIGVVKGLGITADQMGAVLDVPADDVDTFLAGSKNAADVSLEVVKTLPKLQERDVSKGRFGGGRGGFSSGGGGRFGGRRNDGGYSNQRRFSNGGGFGRGRGRG